MAKIGLMMTIDKILSIPKSLWVSLHFFPLKEALKLPVHVRYNAKLLSLKGKIIALGGGKNRNVEHRLRMCWPI